MSLQSMKAQWLQVFLLGFTQGILEGRQREFTKHTKGISGDTNKTDLYRAKKNGEGLLQSLAFNFNNTANDMV